jgi:iron complex transport system substrate-binding protein
MTNITRRHLITMAACLAAPAIAGAARPPRVATLDWALLETLVAMGADVVAGTELRQFRQIAVTPSLPETIADLGLRGTPNLEALHLARPDIIYNSNFYAWADDLMGRIAPVERHSIYVAGENPFDLAERATLAIGSCLALDSGRRLTDDLASKLQVYRTVAAKGDGRSILPINLGDARHYRAFGSDSMFGAVLKHLGLENAWQGASAYSAMAPVGVETLASMPDVWIVLISPTPEDAMAALGASEFWNALPAVRERRVFTLGSINPYGALPAAGRFADLLMEGLSHAWNG